MGRSVVASTVAGMVVAAVLIVPGGAAPTSLAADDPIPVRLIAPADPAFDELVSVDPQGRWARVTDGGRERAARSRHR